jgi:diguanylate cyclase (GGDEF)-like protein
MPLEVIKKPTFVRLMLGVVLLILPLLAWVDYQQGYVIAAVIDSLAVVALLGLILTVDRLGVRQVARLALLVAFVLAAIGSVDKLGSTPNLVWFPVMPVLYVFLGGLRLGCVLTVCHYFFISVSYFFIPSVNGSLETSTWLQVSLAYWTASVLAFSYEYVQQQLNDRLRAMAERDRLTGLLNRRGMETRLEELAAFLERNDVVVTLALLDIDHFKDVNDRHGHDVGDSVLADTGRQLSGAFRRSDYVARWGGEEFLVVLTRTDLEQATPVLDGLRQSFAQTRSLPQTTITMSIGATEWVPGETLEAALKRADTALYQAKQQGRNRISTAPSENSRPASRDNVLPLSRIR